MIPGPDTKDRFTVRHRLGRAMKYDPDADPELVERLWHQPDHLIEAGDRLTAKSCVRTTVKFTADPEMLVVKRYLERSWRHQTKQLFCRSRAAKCWQDTWFLVDHGYPTPLPVAYLENRLGPLRGSSYYVYRFVEGTTLKELATGMKNQRLLRHYVSQLAEIWRFHGTLGVDLTDGHPANFIVDATSKLWVIDLDKLHYFKWTSHLDRLKASFIETVTGVIGDRSVIRYAKQRIESVLEEIHRELPAYRRSTKRNRQSIV
jgi:hypothetical protein